MLKRWPAFTRFLDDGRICLSNNAAERALRGIASGAEHTGGPSRRNSGGCPTTSARRHRDQLHHRRLDGPPCCIPHGRGGLGPHHQRDDQARHDERRHTSPYGASKAAPEMATEVWAKEVEGTGLTIINSSTPAQGAKGKGMACAWLTGSCALLVKPEEWCRRFCSMCPGGTPTPQSWRFDASLGTAHLGF
jgi:hypothetical protein